MRYFTKAAFSLVELSIVLVILGLLVGGVLSGQSLIHAAELRSIAADYQRYSTAVYAFRDKYFGLPGDITNATTIWGDGGTDCTGTPGQVFAAGTCNGNGDGILSYPAGPSCTGEAFRAWQHLALAGLITGNYTGKAGPLYNNTYVVNSNLPSSKFSNVGWAISHADMSAYSSMLYFQYDYRNAMEIGKPSTGGSYVDGSFISPADAWNVDTKLDDGKPGLGKVIAGMYINNCTTSSVSNVYVAEYRVDNPTTCVLFFRYL